jgi:ribosome-binding protein aMBF1 (putative translation factor)
LTVASLPVPACRDCGKPAHDAPQKGPYARRCQSCRSEKAKEMASHRKTPVNAPSSSVDLAKSVQAAVPAARRFQKAIEQKHAVRLEALAALLALNSAIREIQASAQQLMNGHTGNGRVDAELEQQASDPT